MTLRWRIEVGTLLLAWAFLVGFGFHAYMFNATVEALVTDLCPQIPSTLYNKPNTLTIRAGAQLAGVRLSRTMVIDCPAYRTNLDPSLEAWLARTFPTQKMAPNYRARR